MDNDIDPELERVTKLITELGDVPKKHFAQIRKTLPDCVPDPKKNEYAKAWVSLRSDFSNDQIETFIDGYKNLGTGKNELVIPYTVEDYDDFLNNVGCLAHVRYAISLGETGCLRELGGDTVFKLHRKKGASESAKRSRKKGKETADMVVRDAISLLKSGTEWRDLASIISRKSNRPSDRRIRSILKDNQNRIESESEIKRK